MGDSVTSIRSENYEVEKREMMKMDTKTRKPMTECMEPSILRMTDSLCLSRKEEGRRGLIINHFQDCIEREENSSGWYLKNTIEPL